MSLVTETPEVATGMQKPATRGLVRGQWQVLLGATIGNFASPTPALLTVFGVVLVPIAQEFGWPRALVSGVLGVASLVSAATLVPVGWLVDRLGTRRIVLWGNIAFALSMMAFTFTPAQVPFFYGLFILTAFCGTFVLPVVYSRAVAGWFDKGRGAALGFVAGAGNGVGASVLPIVAGVLLANFGWRAAYQGIAVMVLVLGFPVLLTCMRDPVIPRVAADITDAPLPGLSFAAALRTPTFWLLAVAIGLCAACLTAMFTQVIPVLMERHFTLTQAITVLTVFSLTCAGWQWLMGFFLDRFQRPWILAPFYLLAVAGLLLLQFGQTNTHLVISGVLMGLGLGAEYSALPYLASRYFGLRSYGRLVALIYAGITIALGFVPLFMNAIYDVEKSYAYALYAIEAVMTGAALLLFFLPRHDRMVEPPK
jgi:MFS family permease